MTKKAVNIKDYLGDLIADVNACLGCGVCRAKADDACPMWLASNGFESNTPRGIITVVRGYLNNEISDVKAAAEIAYLCTTCMSCVIRCGAVNRDGSYRIKTHEIVVALRSFLVDLGFVPPRVREFFENVLNYGNPYGYSKDLRRKLINELDLEYFDSSRHEYLLWMGCNATYNDVAKESLKALVELLRSSGVSFGVLEDEDCCGHEVLKLGERGLFEELARRNIEEFKKRGVKKIITLCPHGYNAFRNEYPKVDEWMRNVEVYHHTQIINKLLKEGRLKAQGVNLRVTYHDPCYLGRYNNIYEEPREVIKLVGTDLREMPRNRRSSFCCGGGSGGFYTDYLGGGPNDPARIRVREAMSTGAEYLVVACPICKIMLTAGAEAEGVKDKIKIIDITQLITTKT